MFCPPCEACLRFYLHLGVLRLETAVRERISSVSGPIECIASLSGLGVTTDVTPSPQGAGGPPMDFICAAY